MSKYWEYLLYVLEHKKNVFKTCWEKGLYLHAFTHDLSKFLPSEFIPYARYFYGNYPPQSLLKDIGYKDVKSRESVKEDFENAWVKHYKRNKHHPDHYVTKHGVIYCIPYKHVMEMICDLEAMSLKFGGTAQEYYLKNYYKFKLERWTRQCLEMNLDLIMYLNGVCECNEEAHMTIEELINNVDEYYNTHGVIANGTPENNLNDLLNHACEKYNINIYKIVKEQMEEL